MMHGRSRKGCLTCRRRKLKCDELRPVCGNCVKASRECIPSPLALRHDHNPSLNSSATPIEGPSKGFYAYKNTFAADSVWLKVPPLLTFVVVTNPFNTEGVENASSQLLSEHNGDDNCRSGQSDGKFGHIQNALGLEALSAAASVNCSSYSKSKTLVSRKSIKPSSRQDCLQSEETLTGSDKTNTTPLDPRLEASQDLNV